MLHSYFATLQFSFLEASQLFTYILLLLYNCVGTTRWVSKCSRRKGYTLDSSEGIGGCRGYSATLPRGGDILFEVYIFVIIRDNCNASSEQCLHCNLTD